MMPTSNESMLQVLAGGLITVFGFLGTLLFSRTRDLGNQLSELKEEVPKTYVTKEDFNRTVDRFETTQRAHSEKSSENFARLFDRMDGKKDKSR